MNSSGQVQEASRGVGPNALVGGFQIKHLIGEGAMGEVYLAYDTRLGRRVALN